MPVEAETGPAFTAVAAQGGVWPARGAAASVIVFVFNFLQSLRANTAGRQGWLFRGMRNALSFDRAFFTFVSSDLGTPSFLKTHAPADRALVLIRFDILT